MTPLTWQRLKPIILEAMDLPEEEWPTFVTRACQGDSQLIQTALELLRAPPAESLAKHPMIQHLFSLSRP